MMPARQWWAIRDRFKRSMPSQITPSFLESALGVNEGTARDLINQMRYLKLLDAEGKPTAIAEDWRHDDTYASACASILKAVYPEELQHVAPPPVEDRATAQRWLGRRKRVGENAALKMAITYQLVAAANLEGAPDPSKANSRPRPTERARGKASTSGDRARATASAPSSGRAEAQPPAPAAEARPQRAARGPSLHIDVQIHIAADATPAQIDQIFASMAKHLYKHEMDKDAFQPS